MAVCMKTAQMNCQYLDEQFHYEITAPKNISTISWLLYVNTNRNEFC